MFSFLGVVFLYLIQPSHFNVLHFSILKIRCQQPVWAQSYILFTSDDCIWIIACLFSWMSSSANTQFLYWLRAAHDQCHDKLPCILQYESVFLLQSESKPLFQSMCKWTRWFEFSFFFSILCDMGSWNTVQLYVLQSILTCRYIVKLYCECVHNYVLCFKDILVDFF